MRKTIFMTVLDSNGTERSDVAPLEHLEPASVREAAELEAWCAAVVVTANVEG